MPRAAFGYVNSAGKVICRRCFTKTPGAELGPAPALPLSVLKQLDTASDWHEIVDFLKRHCWRDGRGWGVGQVLKDIRTQLGLWGVGELALNESTSVGLKDLLAKGKR